MNYILSRRVCVGKWQIISHSNTNTNSWLKIKTKPKLEYSTSSALKSNDASNSSGKFSSSLNLPQMPYALSVYKTDGRCNKRESYVRNLTDFEGLYQWQLANNTGKEFIIHDGPPYANGDLHTGHALNKIVKDVINRYNVMRGRKVLFTPGWDCHGLPIENKARVSTNSSPLEIRAVAHQFSQQALAKQKTEFIDWGLMGDWENPYITSNSQYVSQELRLFQRLYDQGFVYQDYMPVYWSPSSLTALAESELEYNADHISTSVYVRFKVTHLPSSLNVPCDDDKPLYLLIWTTTPWTLPANKAVCFSSQHQYSIVTDRTSGSRYIVASDLVDEISKSCEKNFEINYTFSGETLVGTRYKHPIYETNHECPLLVADHVGANMGTGLVHTAPAHGHDDFKIALQQNLDRSCMVDERGCYTSDAGPSLDGKDVFIDGNTVVLKMLGNDLFHQSNYQHKYPYDWRTRKPVIVRASHQWFIDTKRILNPALEVLDGVDIIPPVYKTALRDTISQRPYWCISRQRAWGVPIPVFYNSSNEAVINSVITDHICDLVERHGGDIWWRANDEQLLPNSVLRKAGLSSSEQLSRGTDILDIWFDSGVTWSAVLGDDKRADLYIEGIDQIRGWFQSSLLTSVALTGRAPYKTVMMHGFTVDEKGQKMSKSLGNVVSPSQVIYGKKGNTQWPAYGFDVLRWWAASKYCVTNVDIGPAIMKQCNEQLLLLRKRLRFLLGNLYDYNPAEDWQVVKYSEMLPQDKYFLHLLHEYGSKVTGLFDQYEMSTVLNELQYFGTNLSNFYSTISKDRLYCYPADSIDRKSAQQVLHHTFDILTKSFAPILPFLPKTASFTVTAISLLVIYSLILEGSLSESSVFRTGWMHLDDEWNNPDLARKIDVVLALLNETRSQLTESQRLEQANVTIHAEENSSLAEILNELQDVEFDERTSTSPLCEIMQSASLTISTLPIDNAHLYKHVQLSTDGDCYVMIEKTECHRCQRCRRFTAKNLSEPCEICLVNMADTWAS